MLASPQLWKHRYIKDKGRTTGPASKQVQRLGNFLGKDKRDVTQKQHRCASFKFGYDHEKMQSVSKYSFKGHQGEEGSQD